jgi:hypothetical protein
MFKFLNSLTYDGKRGTVLRLEDLGDRFRVSLVFLNPSLRPVAQAALLDAVADEETESELSRLSGS